MTFKRNLKNSTPLKLTQKRFSKTQLHIYKCVWLVVLSLQVFDTQGRDVTPLPLVVVADDPESKGHEKLSLEEVLFKTGSLVFKTSTTTDVVSSRYQTATFKHISRTCRALHVYWDPW